MANKANNDDILVTTIITGKAEVLPDPRKHVNQARVLTVFFDYKGIIHHEFLPWGQTISGLYYLEVLSQPPYSPDLASVDFFLSYMFLSTSYLISRGNFFFTYYILFNQIFNRHPNIYVTLLIFIL